MFLQLLSLEEEEKHKNQDQDDNFRYGYNIAIRGNHARENDVYIQLGGGRWSIGEEIKSILCDDKDYISLSSSRKSVQEESSLRLRVEERESVDTSCSGILPKNVAVMMVVSCDVPPKIQNILGNVKENLFLYSTHISPHLCFDRSIIKIIELSFL